MSARRSAARGARTALALLAWATLAAGTTRCSLQNREGPDVTCADLGCGKYNDCADGIIASCLDGKTMRYHVCDTSDDDDVCSADWQVRGQYKCDQYAVDCEACRPERAGCP